MRLIDYEFQKKSVKLAVVDVRDESGEKRAEKRVSFTFLPRRTRCMVNGKTTQGLKGNSVSFQPGFCSLI